MSAVAVFISTHSADVLDELPGSDTDTNDTAGLNVYDNVDL